MGVRSQLLQHRVARQHFRIRPPLVYPTLEFIGLDLRNSMQAVRLAGDQVVAEQLIRKPADTCKKYHDHRKQVEQAAGGQCLGPVPG